jgi:carbon-monoxide dehydrogenase medium subunit
MKPPNFKYWVPGTVDEAVGFLAQHADDTKLLAGGQSLMPVISMRLARPDYLVDINGLTELDYVRADGNRLRIGALTRHATLMESADVQRHCPLISKALPFVGHTAIRHRGTIGGSIVHADPSAELPAVAAALDAEMIVTGPNGQRTIPAAEFFITFFMTSMEPDEMLTEVAFPIRAREKGTSVAEFARRHGDFAVAGVAISIDANGGGLIDSARVCAFGVDDVPRRVDAAESLLAGQAPTRALLAEAGAATAASVDPETDMHASGAYRQEMAGVLTRRGLEAALTEAGLDLA